MTPRRVGILTGTIHFGITVATVGHSLFWFAIVGFPAVPLATKLLKAWDPPWANFPSDYPVAHWSFLILVYGSNFLLYSLLGWAIATKLTRNHEREQNSEI